ncbi:zf-HC2 domain-containing protein [Actinomycetes bacterium KLBMP 9797]
MLEPPGPGTRPEPPCVHPDAGAYALGLLEPDERARYERHLRDCPRCTRAVRSLAPLIELLEAVDADSLLAATDPPPGRHPPHPVRVISPPRPASRLLPPNRPGSRGDIGATGHMGTGGRGVASGRSSSGRPWRASRGHATGPGASRSALPLRRFVLAAAVVTVVSMLGFVTFSARSSVDAPPTATDRSPASIVDPMPADRAAATPPPASPSPSPSPGAAQVPPHRAATPPTEPSPDPTTAPPTTDSERPNTLDAGPANSGALPAPQQYEARDPQTGTTATVEITPGTDGAKVTVTLSEVSGARDGTITVTTVAGTTTQIAGWHLSLDDDTVVAQGESASHPDDIARVNIHDDNNLLLLSIPTD